MIYKDITIGQTEHKGRGMFAAEAIAAGELVEMAPVIVMSAADRVHLDRTLLHDYIFEWQPDGVALCCMALGYVPIYNHSFNANAEYFMDYEAQTISVKTVRAIPEGEEITINYNGDWDDATPLWFSVQE